MPLRHAVLALAVVSCAGPTLAFAHGGSYAPPTFGSPRNPARSPGAPPPPPEKTPNDVFGPSTPSGGSGPDAAETPGARDFSHWSRWWNANRWRFVGEAIRPAVTESASSPETRRNAVAALLAVLGDPNEDLASGAAIALGRLGDTVAVQPLVGRLKDRSARPTVREAAALGLGLLPAVMTAAAAADVATCHAALTTIAISPTESGRLRAMAVYALGMQRDIQSLPMLSDLSEDAECPLDVSCAARTATGLLAGDVARAKLEAWLTAPSKTDADAFLRAYAAHGLARLVDSAATPALLRAAKDPDLHVRSASLQALGALPAADEAAVRLLVGALRDTNSACRGAAALSLGRSGHRKAQAALEEALRTKDGSLRCHAAIGLGLLARRLGDPSVAGAVPLLLKDRSDRDLRSAAAVACGIGRLKSAAADLRDIAADDVAGEPRAYAAIALGMIGDTASVPILHTLVRNSSVPALPWEAAAALGLLGDATAAEELRGVLAESQNLYVQGNAAIGLGRVGGVAAAETLLGVVKDESRSGIVRAMAAVGLGLALGGSPTRGYGLVGADLPWIVVTPTVAEVVTIL